MRIDNEFLFLIFSDTNVFFPSYKTQNLLKKKKKKALSLSFFHVVFWESKKKKKKKKPENHNY